ncbi:MAG: T9SS type A sorting domain-containing protein [Bacteroidetes bacterium]|nr:T9SS type A sorting domain-containing protein [Bacteroidota bacterium]
MKKLLPLFFFVFLFYQNSQSQTINVNPDPNGDPWIAGQLRPLTDEDWKFLKSLPELTVPLQYTNRILPSSVDNSQEPYFRPIFNQDGGSCGQASGIGYAFTYEIDFARGIPANTMVNQYPTHFTWNFLNGGVGGGSWYWDGWMIIHADGCPNVADYGGSMWYGGQSRWMSGYESYYNGMHNRVLDMFALNVSTPEGLEILKNWLYDHVNGSDAGGLANFAAGVSGSFYMTSLPVGTPEAGEPVVVYWDASVNHALTFIGYNDSIRYDFNGDGQYTINEDINGDDIIDLRDWEIGGLLFANSWGPGFGDNGKSYMMYKLLADATENGGIWGNTVHMITARETFEPYVTVKATVKHTSRDKVKIMVGVSKDTADTEPACLMSFPLFSFQGGPLYMQGGNTEADKTIEIGLDITPILGEITPGQPAKFFLRIIENDPNYEGTGEVISYSIIDYTNGIEEVVSDQQNVPITENGETTLWLIKTVDFNAPAIITEELPEAITNEPYSYQLEAAGGIPPYTWDIVMDYEEGTLLCIYPAITEEQLIPTQNDDGFATKDLAFTFPFYGEFYNHVALLTDGSVVFEDQFQYIRSEENIMSFKTITPYGADLMLYPEQGDAMYYSGDETHATFRWKTSMYDLPDVDVDVAVTLYPDGRIEFYYGNDITEGTNWGAGISKGDGQNYVIANISNSYSIPDNYASQFTAPEYPMGMSLSQDGVFSGTPIVNGHTWEITFRTTDDYSIFTTKTLAFTTLNVGYSDPLADNLISNLQSVPNPFNEKTIIGFSLAQECPVTLDIINSSGQVIKTFTRNQNLPAGQYSFTWDGKNDEGQECPAGVYFYKVSAGHSTLTGKLIFFR